WQTEQRNHDGVRGIAFSPDGRWLVVGTRSGQIHRWDLAREDASGMSWQAHGAELSSLQFSRDGKNLYSASQDGNVKIWENNDGMRDLDAIEAGSPVEDLALSPDGSRIAYCWSNQVRVMDRNRAELGRWQFEQGISALAITPVGQVFAATSDGGIVL